MSDQSDGGDGDKSDPTPLSRDRNFILYNILRLANTMATQMMTVAVGWQVYQLTGDPVDLGLVGLSQFGPLIVLFLAAGVVTDRFDRRAIILTCSMAHGFAMALLLAYALSGERAVWPFFAILLVHGVARAFIQPPLTAILPNIVTPQQFPKAVAIATSISKAAHLGGPAIGGLLLAAVGSWVYLAALVMFVISGLTAVPMKPMTNIRTTGAIRLEMVVGGFAYIWRNKIVLGTMSADIIAGVFAGIMGIMPVFAADILNVGPEGLGVMRAMPAAGGVVVGVLLARMRTPRHLGPALFASLAVFALATIAFSLSEVFWVSLTALAVYGAADMVSTYTRHTIVQLVTPDDMRGRVSAVHAVIANGSNEIGDFRAGISAGLVGTVPAVWAGGAVTLAVTVLWVRLFPEIRRLDGLSDIHKHAKRIATTTASSGSGQEPA